MNLKRAFALLLLLCFLVGCGGAPAATPDAVATQVAVMHAAAATLTAQAALPADLIATPTPAPVPTRPPFPTTALQPTATLPLPTPTEPSRPGQIVPDLANQVIWALKNRDMQAVAAHVHPISGLRFTPYAFVQPSDLAFPLHQLPKLLTDSTVYRWGAYDGSGEPIDLTFAQYYERFVYDADFAHAEAVSYNERIGGAAGIIDNSREFYPGAVVVEYHFSGFDPQYAGMDWRSLRLVFQQHDGAWYLVGIIHDEWTT